MKFLNEVDGITIKGCLAIEHSMFNLLSFGKKPDSIRYHVIVWRYSVLSPAGMLCMQAQVHLWIFMPLIKRHRALPGKTKKTCHTNTQRLI
jgi:hypothetical protein